jgi:hypothetical protein
MVTEKFSDRGFLKNFRDKFMKSVEMSTGKPFALKLWLIFGVFIIVLSAIFLLPPIYIAFTDSASMGSYVGTYFIPFLLGILFIFIILVVIYIYWHMTNQTDLMDKLEKIETKIDSNGNHHVNLEENTTVPSFPVRSEVISTAPEFPTQKEVKKIEPEAENVTYHRTMFDKLTIKYLIDMGMAVTFILVIITGLMKFPLILNALEVNQSRLPTYELSIIHDYSGLSMGILIMAHLVFNFKWLAKTTKKKLISAGRSKVIKRSVVASVIILLLLFTLSDASVQEFLFSNKEGIHIQGFGDFEFDDSAVQSIRPDIFKEGHFSVFDVLVFLNSTGKIKMNYHFNEDLNTHEIDDINGRKNWWYEAYYDGGWPEANVYRMDHYPYKDKMYIKIERADKSFLNSVYKTFADEIQRKEANGGNVIVPKVTIKGTKSTLTFNDVLVKPHNQRSDFLQEGVITALDVIMSLGDQGLITYELGWYNTIGRAEVKNYFVDQINGDKSEGRCGFVYEAGSNSFKGFKGNHIHIPSDIRIINSPEYEEWFWICI